MSSDVSGFARHITACNTAIQPDTRPVFRLAGQDAGFVDPRIAPALEKLGLADGNAFSLADPSQLEALGQRLADDGLYRSHHELFDVIIAEGTPPVARIDRGALPLFGLLAVGVHLNGLVRRDDGLHLWVARRSRSKRLDPGKLDHLVAGGVSAGLTPHDAIIKEAAEEASLPPDIMEGARQVGTIRYTLDRPEGLRRDLLVCYDLVLPDMFTPEPADGEVEEFLLLPIAEVFRLVRDTDEFKFNVNLVLIDLFLREGLIDPQSPGGKTLRRELHGNVEMDGV
ncbi:NUDIX hydrolase [Acetobacter fallax]|uniref:NUDIX domain-containing protein n=1 Tax=Acetobacter fallax TaxID=1737473 RepID=A0ABX0K951_9PROT|nr:NUDIX domain-containing protein [Acetobacter fallax]NHO32480.1 NUDIX domain-containing protein [Acetobacter fallax]NHO36040.1 NUDIX domain-containing protein [Acetobacter fallax]